MWTRRKLFPTLSVPATPHPAAVATPLFTQQERSGSSDFTLAEDAYNFVASLGYTLVPALSPHEASELLSWALPVSWVYTSKSGLSAAEAAARHQEVVSSLLQSASVLQACSQVEYFFFGTDNGQVFVMPLLPPHLLDTLLADGGETTLPGLADAYKREGRLIDAAAARRGGAEADRAREAALTRVPVNCVGRRLLHRHVREEPVSALDHLGVLVASAVASVDCGVALSIVHPRPVGVVCIPHPSAVRSLKLWEGGVFTEEAATTSGEVVEAEGKDLVAVAARQWGDHVRAAEPTAVYVFTGDESGVVRLWRVDVVERTYCLQHVLVCSGNMVGMRSPLDPFAREDTTRRVPARAADCVVHCLEIDVVGHRLFGGTEGGAYVWALDALPWRGPETQKAAAVPSSNTADGVEGYGRTPASYAVRHPLCWSEPHRTPLPCALRCWAGEGEGEGEALPASSPTLDTSDQVVAYRAARLVNHHVWIVDAAAVQAEMARAQHHAAAAAVAEEKVSGWKPKYGRVLTGGAAVGVVSNTVRLAAPTEDAATSGGLVATRLTRTVVTVNFDGGEVKNDLRVPLSCVVPVLYPVGFLRTPGTACFSLKVLAPRRRVLTSCADGKVCVWVCNPADDAKGTAETYLPQLVTENRQAHRGLGRHLCLLRSPDVFTSCSYDDGLVKEWHVYDEPELLLRCARRFTLTPFVSDGTSGGGSGKELAAMVKSMTQSSEDKVKKEVKAAGQGTAGSDNDDDDEEEEDEGLAAGGGDVVAGIACAAAYPPFGALFLVGAFESAIQAYSLTEVVGCEPPRNFVYNGHKTVHLPSSMVEDVYHEL